VPSGSAGFYRNEETMIYMTCDTCTYWGSEEGRRQKPCNSDKIGACPDTDGLDDYDGHAPCFTGPNFGCIHHEAKE
jgi:hypothetical protein